MHTSEAFLAASNSFLGGVAPGGALGAFGGLSFLGFFLGATRLAAPPSTPPAPAVSPLRTVVPSWMVSFLDLIRAKKNTAGRWTSDSQKPRPASPKPAAHTQSHGRWGEYPEREIASEVLSSYAIWALRRMRSISSDLNRTSAW